MITTRTQKLAAPRFDFDFHHNPSVPSCWVRRSDGKHICLIDWATDRYEFGHRDMAGRLGPVLFVLTEDQFLNEMRPT